MSDFPNTSTQTPSFFPSATTAAAGSVDLESSYLVEAAPMEEGTLERANSNDVLTIREVAQRLRCSKAHVSNLMNGKVEGVPTLTHISMGRRKLVRREWLDTWMDAYKTQC